MNGLPSASAIWQEARAPDGRAYFYNTQTKETSWQKPQALLTPTERALATQPWKEHTAPDGRKYYAHSETRQTVWEMPDAYRQALDQAQMQAQAQPASRPASSTPGPTFVSGGSNVITPYNPHRDSPSAFENRRDFSSSNGITLPLVTKEVVPDYSSFEEAETAFLKLLRRSNVQPEWTWEQAMRTTIKDPQYRALKDPKDRKAAFEKYTIEVREQEKEKAKERLAKLRTDFSNMLRTHPEIKHYSRWKSIRPIIEHETVFRSAENEEERKQLFAEHILELKKRNLEDEAAARRFAINDLTSILKSLDLEPYSRWSQAQEMIENTERMQSDDRFKSLSKSDILTAFENHIKSLERTFNDVRQEQKSNKARRERQNRDAFISLLQEKRAQGKINAGTKWNELLPDLENESRYINVLGQAGSTPLDLFWDVIEEEERALRGRRNDVYDVLEDKRYEVTPQTTFDEFLRVMAGDSRTAKIDRDTSELIFQRLYDKVLKRNEEEKHAADRQRRRNVDALRSRIKHLEPPVRITDTWDQVRSRVEAHEEYRVLETDELRKSAYEKVVKRLKEKEEDVDREKDRRRGRRGDERDPRAGHRETRHGRLSQSPEADPYEADRRKAMAARERQYRKMSLEISPPRSSHRDRRERDDRHGRLERSPPPRPGLYDRDRRDREDERERLYRTRADPRSSRDELNYGEESRSATSERRRRRESPEESVDSGRRKRHRKDSRGTSRERRKTKTPEVQKEAVEPAGVRSGSEEGEIEED